MSEVISTFKDEIREEVSCLKIEQRIVSEKFDLFMDYSKQSFDRQDKSIEKIGQLAEETARRNDVLEKELDYKIKDLELRQTINFQEQTIKQLTFGKKVSDWWKDPNTLPSKIVLMIATVGSLALANHFNVLDGVLKVLLK